MTFYNWASLFGVPTIVSLIIGFLVGKLRQTNSEAKALKLGLQALLRDRLIERYQQIYEKGYADVADRDSWENMYTQYHSLGANGVMDDIHKKFMALPTRKEDEHEN